VPATLLDASTNIDLGAASVSAPASRRSESKQSFFTPRQNPAKPQSLRCKPWQLAPDPDDAGGFNSDHIPSEANSFLASK
jgi:hypothetical protein